MARPSAVSARPIIVFVLPSLTPAALTVLAAIVVLTLLAAIVVLTLSLETAQVIAPCSLARAVVECSRPA